METERKSLYSINELDSMLVGEFDSQVAAARRIWTDWEVIPEKHELFKHGVLLHNLLLEKTIGRHTWHLMLALGSIQYEPAINDILELLRSCEDENVRGFAADSFTRYSKNQFTEEMINAFWNILEDPNPLVVKINTVRAMQVFYENSYDLDVAKRFIELLEIQENTIITSEIIKLIGSIGNIEVTPWIIHLMVARRTELNIDAASSALDLIAEKNGFESRKGLINHFTNNMQQGSN